jgi:hydroxypyruvate isomerase
MTKTISRRTAIRTAVAGGAVLAAAGLEAAVNGTAQRKRKPAAAPTPQPLKGNIRHSVSRWCYGDIPLDEFCGICKKIGIESIELLDPKDWPVVKSHGLTVAIAQGAGLGIDRGFNDPALHDELVASFEKVIPMVAEAGLTNLICFSGRRNGVTDLQGWENCEKGIRRITPVAEKYNVVLTMELLNSIGHKDYLCDHTVWGAELCRRVNSPNFKLLYDIYHMQIMEGNIIEHIRKYHTYFSHIHTGGNPGRGEIDETQELCYPAIIRALVDTGYRGFIGQEFVPKQPDKIASLEKCIRLCDV